MPPRRPDRAGRSVGSRDIWRYAVANDYAIVSKDEDFLHLANTDPSGPLLIWVRMGNCRKIGPAGCLRPRPARPDPGTARGSKSAGGAMSEPVRERVLEFAREWKLE